MNHFWEKNFFYWRFPLCYAGRKFNKLAEKNTPEAEKVLLSVTKSSLNNHFFLQKFMFFLKNSSGQVEFGFEKPAANFPPIVQMRLRKYLLKINISFKKNQKKPFSQKKILDMQNDFLTTLEQKGCQTSKDISRQSKNYHKNRKFFQKKSSIDTFFWTYRFVLTTLQDQFAKVVEFFRQDFRKTCTNKFFLAKEKHFFLKKTALNI